MKQQYFMVGLFSLRAARTKGGACAEFFTPFLMRTQPPSKPERSEHVPDNTPPKGWTDKLNGRWLKR